MEYMSKKGSHLEAPGWWVLSMVELAAAMTAMPSWEALAPESVLYVPPWPPSLLVPHRSFQGGADSWRQGMPLSIPRSAFVECPLAFLPAPAHSAVRRDRRSMVGFSNTSDPRKAKVFLLRLVQLRRDKEVRGEPCRDNTKGIGFSVGIGIFEGGGVLCSGEATAGRARFQGRAPFW